jgi:hypothetical protein
VDYSLLNEQVVITVPQSQRKGANLVAKVSGKLQYSFQEYNSLLQFYPLMVQPEDPG